MRGGHQDPFGPDGPDLPGPNTLVVLAWAGVAVVAFVIAMAATIYSIPKPSGRAEVAAVDMTPTGSLPSSSGETSITGIVARSDFSMQSRDPDTASQIAALKVENAALRQAVGSLDRTIAALDRRLAELEEKFRSVTGSVKRVPPPRPEEQGGPGVAVPASDAAGLVADAPPTRHTPFGVELGSYDDLKSLEADWRSMSQAAPQLFADLDPVATIRDRDGRPELLLVAGPFTSASDAAARCVLVERADRSCLPAFFVGQPLSTR